MRAVATTNWRKRGSNILLKLTDATEQRFYRSQHLKALWTKNDDNTGMVMFDIKTIKKKTLSCKPHFANN